MFIAVLICLPIASNAQWKQRSNPSNNRDLFDVQMIGAKAYAGGLNSALLKSNDSGKTWSSLSLSIPENIRALSFLNADTGCIIGENARIQKTTNGGSTWTQKYVRTAAYAYDIQLKGMNGLAVGKDMLIVSSNNQGESWNVDTTFKSNKSLNSVCFLNDGNCWAVGDSGYILNKNIQRRKWNTWQHPSKINFNSVLGIGDSVLIISGGMPDSLSAGKYRNLVLLSRNGGQSFSESTLSELRIPNGAYFQDADTGFICGSSGLISKSYQVLTQRGLQVLGTASSLNAIYFQGNTGLCVGDGGCIYRTSNRGAYGLKIPDFENKEFKLFPNPSSQTCQINTNSPIDHVSVFAANGKEIQNAYNPLNAEISLENPGVYCIIIMSNGRKYSEFLILR